MIDKENCRGDWAKFVVRIQLFLYVFLASWQFICFDFPPCLGVSVVNADG
jgi:hypothetical protein